MSKEIAEKEGFVIGEEVLCFILCFIVFAHKRLVTVERIRDVVYGCDDETALIFLEERAGYYTSDEIYTKKMLLDMLNPQDEARDGMFTITYEKTGLKIKIDIVRGYLMLRTHELEALGFKADDVWGHKTDAIEMYEMDAVFEKAKEKAVRKIGVENGKKYTASPWNDFTKEFLVQKLEEEIKEWKEKYDKKELLDIINVAAFIYLCVEEK
jgi:predicted house-cleaning noncanonical NTP pyrophosphatase (MazG superfamily)